MCARCAAATPDCRVLDTAPPVSRIAPAGAGRALGKPDMKPGPAVGTVGEGAAAVFSDHAPAAPSSTPMAAWRSSQPVPAGRTRS